ncbi:MAG: hypothetical protein KVP17_000696 [Porospora cf. gigantea B]|nr:MAG: hypothetical protein KVP17_000696 [Porospora cf. gigantea B]
MDVESSDIDASHHLHTVTEYRVASLSAVFAAMAMVGADSELTEVKVPQYLSALQLDIIPASSRPHLLKALLVLLPCVAHLEESLPRHFTSEYSVNVDEFLHRPASPKLDQASELHEDVSWLQHVMTASDPGIRFQWYLGSRSGQSNFINGWALAERLNMRPPPLPVPVALIDSGCAPNHPDINYFDAATTQCERRCRGWNAADSGPDFAATSPFHGVYVMGVIAAKSDNGVGLQGACPICSIHCVKVSDHQGAVSSSALLRAYAYLLDNIDVFKISNHSYSGLGFLKSEQLALKKLSSAGHIMVMSAGNENKNFNSSHDFVAPAMYNLPTSVVVGSTDVQGNMAGFSNRGKELVGMWAPGVAIPTFTDDIHANRISFKSGTTFSATIATAAIGFSMGYYSDVDPELRLQLLKDSSLPVPFGGTESSGGYLNVERFLEYLQAIPSQKS